MDTTEIDTAPGAELLALQQIARIVSRGDDAESRIQDILRHIGQSLGLVRARVLLADLPAGELFIRYAHGLTHDALERGRYRIGEGVSGRVFETGEAALVGNVHDEPGYLARAVSRDAIPPEQVTFLAVPIVRGHMPVGVLAAHRLRSHVRPTRGDLALLEVVATLIGQLLCEREPEDRAVEPARARAGVNRQTPPDEPNAGCDLMLRTAEHWYLTGRLHQATDMYLRVAQQHPEGEPILRAQARLLQIARDHESRGASRLALDVLERLQRALARNAPDRDDGNGGQRTEHKRVAPRGEEDGDNPIWDFFGGGLGPSATGRFGLGTR